jgi:hypothetical protein
MRVRLYLVGVCLILVGGMPIALTGYPGVFEFVMAAIITLLIAVPLGACFLVLGGLHGEKRRSGIGVLLGRVLAYLIGLAFLLPGTFITGTVVHDLVTVGLHPDVEYVATVAMMILGPLLGCAGMAVLVVAGRIRVDDSGAIRL